MDQKDLICMWDCGHYSVRLTIQQTHILNMFRRGHVYMLICKCGLLVLLNDFCIRLSKRWDKEMRGKNKISNPTVAQWMNGSYVATAYLAVWIATACDPCPLWISDEESTLPPPPPVVLGPPPPHRRRPRPPPPPSTLSSAHPPAALTSLPLLRPSLSHLRRFLAIDTRLPASLSTTTISISVSRSTPGEIQDPVQVPLLIHWFLPFGQPPITETDRTGTSTSEYYYSSRRKEGMADAAVEEKVVEEVARLSCNASNFDGQLPWRCCCRRPC
jgi:hypothetical protein